MAKTGPIILVEDDDDDIEIITAAIKEAGIPNEVIGFTGCEEAFDYLKTMIGQPFIILSDMNMPRQNGLEFKRQIDNDPELRRKSIPFIFYSTSVDRDVVDTAYMEMNVQGFFLKENEFAKIKMDVKMIYDYWQCCRHPNS